MWFVLLCFGVFGFACDVWAGFNCYCVGALLAGDDLLCVGVGGLISVLFGDGSCVVDFGHGD